MSNKVELKLQLEKNTVVKYLRELADSIESGSLTLQKNDETLHLEPAPEMELEVKASDRSRKQRVSLAATWQKHVDGKPVVPTFRILSEIPKE